MSSFFVSADETLSSKQTIFSHSKQNEKNESYLSQWHSKGFQNIKLVSLYSKSLSRGNSKCLYFATVQMKHIVQSRPFFSHSKQNEKKISRIRHNGRRTLPFRMGEEHCLFFGLCVSLVLMQDEDIWNFQGSLTLNKGKLM